MQKWDIIEAFHGFSLQKKAKIKIIKDFVSAHLLSRRTTAVDIPIKNRTLMVVIKIETC